MVPWALAGVVERVVGNAGDDEEAPNRRRKGPEKPRNTCSALDHVLMILFVQPRPNQVKPQTTSATGPRTKPTRSIHIPHYRPSSSLSCPMTTRLLASLTRALGVPQARQEFKWMQAASASATAPSLDEMVRRRSLGEPLQYILGAAILVQDVFTFSF